MTTKTLDIESSIRRLEALEVLSPNCNRCAPVYEAIRNGTNLPSGPSHKASEWCKSGKHPHCTCDTCF
jgi:hypothetical protein